MLGVYRVLQEVTEAFPSVLFEMCSSGGGRFDAGMLTISPQVQAVAPSLDACCMPLHCDFAQIWTSDNTDAMCRLPIQYGSSIAYPLSCLGAHISASPNHQMHRLATLKTRFLVSTKCTTSCFAAMLTRQWLRFPSFGLFHTDECIWDLRV